MRWKQTAVKWLMMATIPLALLVSLSSWAMSSPVGSSPDDDYHMASIWCGDGLREGFCSPGAGSDERSVPAALPNTSACYAFYQNQAASCPVLPSSQHTDTNRGNWAGEAYPPFYYWVMSHLTTEDVSASVVTMRIVNATVFVSILCALLVLLRNSMRGPVLWATAATIVPLGMFIIPSVNPSSWAITSAVALWPSVYGYLTEDRAGRRVAFAVIAVVSALIGAGARGDSAVYAGLAIAVAYVLAFDRTRRYLLLSIFPFALMLLMIVMFLGAGHSTSLTQSNEEESASLGGLVALGFTNLTKLPELWAGTLGTWGLGWLDTPMPGSVWVSMLVVFGGLCFWGSRRMPARKAVAVSAMILSLVIVPMFFLVKDRVVVGSAVQPRYVYPLVIMFACVILVGWATRSVGLTRLQGLSVAVLVSVANSVALHSNIRRYVTGMDVLNPNLDSSVEWWASGITPMGIWLIGSLAFAVAAFGVSYYALRDSHRLVTAHESVTLAASRSLPR